MKLTALFIGGSIILLCFFLCGCQEESTTIAVTIESLSPHAVNGNITINGMQVQQLSMEIFDKPTFTFDKSALSQQTPYNVTVTIEPQGGDGEQSIAYCTSATRKASFVVNIQHNINLRSCE